MENQAKVQKPSINVLLLSWVIFVALYVSLKNSAAFHDVAGVLLSAAVFLANLFAFIYALQVWKKSSGKAKFIFACFSLALFSILIDTVIYEGIFNILNVYHFTKLSFAAIATSRYHLIYFGYLIFQLLAWIYLFPKITASARNRNELKLYIPFAIISLFMLLLFVIIFKLEVTHYHFSSFGFYNILHAILGFSGFILAIFCLASAKHKGILYLALGFIIAKSGGLIMIFGTFAQKFATGSSIETLWILGLSLMAYGLMNFKKTKTYNTDPKTWIYPVNSLRAQLSFWIFALFIFSALISFGIYYLVTEQLFLQTTRDLQILFPALCLYSVITVIFSKFFADKISMPLSKIEDLINLFMQAKEPEQPLEDKYYNIQEVNNIESFLRKSFNVLKEKNQAKEELSNCAVQVSHDIRSPLAALTTLLQDLPELAEQKRILIRNATQRIGDIANNLLAKYRTDSKITDTLRRELVSSLLDVLISEKRIQIANKPIKLALEINPDAQGAFAKINSNEFKRVISNLINNAVEAIKSKGTIRVLAQKKENNLIIKIIDNGKGIPADLLPKIQKGGVSIGKTGGLGLGISGAIQNITEWQGNYALESKPGKGTVFTIKLPLSDEPDWFQGNIKLVPQMRVSILDDDESIHNTWNAHFNDYLQNKQIAVEHFYNPDDFVKHCEGSSLKQDLFLVDYELIGFDKTGLDLIKELNLRDHAILVTSRYNELELREQAKALGIRIIPKNFAPYIPIHLMNQPEQPELIFIDDSELLTSSWEQRAILLHKKITTFNKSKDFKKIMHMYNKDVPIYIDSNIGEEISGEELAKELYKYGFKNIYLATGREEYEFGEMPWIRKIVSKNPPF